MIRILFIATVFFISFEGSGAAQLGSFKDDDSDQKGPVEVTSDRMRSENKGEKIVFSGNVIGRWGNMEIRSDILEIYDRPEDKGGSDEVVAIGNVKLKKENKRAEGDRAVYYDSAQKVILTGSPKAYAWEDDNKIEGREMIFLLEEDRFLVKDRVIMKFYPKDSKDKSSGKKKRSSRRSSRSR